MAFFSYTLPGTDKARTLHYLESGAGPAVLLIHGFTNAGMAWMNQFAALTFAGYRCIVPGLYGHGLSSPADELTTVEALAADLIALLDQLHIEKLIVCGLSLGGMIALEMALSYPDRVDRLIIANSQASFNAPELEPVVEGWLSMFAQADGPQRRLKATWPAMLNVGFRESAAGKASFESWCQLAQRASGASLSHIALGMRRFDVRHRLSEISAPTLVIAGGQDKLFALPAVQAISDGVQHGRFEVIAEAAHISSLDSPDAFNTLLLGMVK